MRPRTHSGVGLCWEQGLRSPGRNQGAGCNPQDVVLFVHSSLRARRARVAEETRPAVWPPALPWGPGTEPSAWAWPSTARAQCCRLRVLGACSRY